jgi:hypothetical protein
LTLLYPHKTFSFFVSIIIRTIITTKFLIKHMQNYAMPLNTWIWNELCGTCMFNIACIFFRLGSLPSFEIINPTFTLKNTIKARLNWIEPYHRWIAKTSLYFQKSSANSKTFFGCNLKFTFTICGFSSFPKLSFANYCSYVNVQPTIYNS